MQHRISWYKQAREIWVRTPHIHSALPAAQRSLPAPQARDGARLCSVRACKSCNVSDTSSPAARCRKRPAPIAPGRRGRPGKRIIALQINCAVLLWNQGSQCVPPPWLCPVSAGKAGGETLFRVLRSIARRLAAPSGWGTSQRSAIGPGPADRQPQICKYRTPATLGGKRIALGTRAGQHARTAGSRVPFLLRAAGAGGVSCPGRILRLVAVRPPLAAPHTGPLLGPARLSSVNSHRSFSKY
jgi:hypothetical protein